MSEADFQLSVSYWREKVNEIVRVMQNDLMREQGISELASQNRVSPEVRHILAGVGDPIGNMYECLERSLQSRIRQGTLDKTA